MPELLETMLKGRRSPPSQLIEVLHDIQEAQGYISRNAFETVSKELGIPLIEVFRVANFYKAFSLQPRGKHVITLCKGTACHVRGANPLIEQALTLLGVEEGEATDDGLFSVESVNCIGACALAPVVVLNGTYHPHMTPAKLRALIRSVRRKEEKRANV